MSRPFDPLILSDQGNPSRRRWLPLLLTIIAHALLLLLLIRLAPPFAKMAPPRGGQLIAVTVAPAEQEQAARAPSRHPAHRSPAAASPQAPEPPPPIKLPTTAEPWVVTPGLEHFDLRQVPPAPRRNQPSDDSFADDASATGQSDQPVAYGPAGQPLYDAQWYREPTDTELSYYTKRARPGPGFGEIGCQTVARFHVDNCVELAETAGSGYARAVKEAAWQFLVVPPRVGGRSMVGAWVRIRIVFSERKPN